MKRKIAVFISMLLLTASVMLGSVPANAMEYDEKEARTVAVTVLATWNSIDFSEYLTDENIAFLEQMGDEGQKVIDLYTSWQQTKDELGEFKEVVSGSEEYAQDEENRIVTVTLKAEYANGQMSISVPVLLPSATQADYELADQNDIVVSIVKPMGQVMKEAGLNTVMGIVIVFLMLIVISFVISLFKFINKPEKKKEPLAPAAPSPAVPVPAPAKEAAEDVTDDCEIVAVITAAVMASMEESGEEVPADGLVVRSIRRRSSNRWQSA